MSRILVQLCLALMVALVYAHTDQGVLYVDELTIHKVVDGSKPALVRFDKEYTWGDEHDQFKELAKQVGEGRNDLLILSLPMSAANENSAIGELAKLYDIHEKDWPAFGLFKKGVSSKQPPIKYGGAKTAQEMLQWLSLETGEFFGLKGQILEFETLIGKYVNSKDPQQILMEVKTLPLNLTEEEQGYADYYVKTFQRLAEKGSSYVLNEQKRLKKLLEDKNIASGAKAVFQARLNIMLSFAGKLQLVHHEDEL